MKIFGIGLSKTGTTSLAHALDILGYKVRDCLGLTIYRKGQISSIDKTALKNHDALTDTPIPSFYRELDREYPNSKFILTIRELDAWLNSCKKQFNQKLADKQTDAHNELFMDLYGSTVFDEDKFRVGYTRFVDGVLEYFKERPNDLLVMDISNGDGWEKLCPFLGKSVPDIPFPKSNVTQIRWVNLHGVASSIRNLGSELRSIYKELPPVQKQDNGRVKGTLLSILPLDTTSRISRCTKKIEKLVRSELNRTNSNIPVMSKNLHGESYEMRKNWNHFWLIDTSDGDALPGKDSTGHTINIALIEDGYPFLGIVYSPAHDVLYYSALDKGAYKVTGEEQPVRIKLDAADNIAIKQASHMNQSSESASIKNLSLSLCQAIEKKKQVPVSIENSWEWQTAAGHAFIRALGYQLIDTASNHELKYNKVDWKNPKVVVKKKRPR